MIKGYCLGDIGSGGLKVDLLNALGAASYVAGPWEFYKGPAPPLEKLNGEWFVWLAEHVPSADLVRRAYAAKGEKVVWQLGNEPSPYVYPLSVEFVAEQTIAQVNAIREIEPHARMYLSMGHQVQAPYNSWSFPCWMDQLWPLLAESDKGLSSKVRVLPALSGFHCHVYCEMEKTVPTGYWFLDPEFAELLVRRNLRWLRKNGLAHLPLRVSEMGWSRAYETNEAIAALVHLRQAISVGIEGVYVYAAQRSEEDEGDARSYTLLTRDGEHTLPGRVFQALELNGVGRAARPARVNLKELARRVEFPFLPERSPLQREERP